MAAFQKVKGPTIAEAFEDFLVTKEAEGASKNTILTYRHMFHSFTVNNVNVRLNIEDLTDQILRRAVAELARSDRSRNTIRSYTATMATFLSWARAEGLTEARISLFKGEEAIPKTYSQAEMERLLKRPKNGSNVGDFRAWAIINLLVNNGLRAGTVREIQIRDVRLQEGVIMLRHTKRRKTQAVPLCPELEAVLREWMRIRGGREDDWLFPDVTGAQMTANCLRNAIRRYNLSRGVRNTSIHAFRHTFARTYIVDCKGNALKLQRLLGHETLDMTKKYVRLYDQDLIDDFRTVSPLHEVKKKTSRQENAR